MEMFYTRDNRWALSRGVRAMRCAACDAELILTNVVSENTVAIRGFEHHVRGARLVKAACNSSIASRLSSCISANALIPGRA